MTTKADPMLLEFCESETQREIVQAVIDQGSLGKAAAALGRDRRGLARTFRAVERRAAEIGLVPSANAAQSGARILPPGHVYRGMSELVDNRNGQAIVTWYKSQRDPDYWKREGAQLFAESLAEHVEGRFQPVPPPAPQPDDLLNLFPIGDAHMGMYSWARETGEDFDCDIAFQDLVTAMRVLVDGAPPARQAIVLNIGDFIHSDRVDDKSKSGHHLDVDTRWSRVIDMATDAMIELVRMALERHELVHVFNVIGNHDEQASKILSTVLRAFFRNEPRVNVDPSLGQYRYFRHGRTLLGFTHGDKPKRIEDLGQIMAYMVPQDWGRSEFRYWFHGHIHHKRVLDTIGVTIESLRTLAAKDWWHASHGYMWSPRDMQRRTFHREFGEHGSQCAPIKLIRECQRKSQGVAA